MRVETGFLGNFVFVFNGYFALGVGPYDIVTTRPKWLETFRRFNGILLALGLTLLLLLLVGVATLHLRTLKVAVLPRWQLIGAPMPGQPTKAQPSRPLPPRPKVPTPVVRPLKVYAIDPSPTY